jgi:hypothetical protein
MHQAADAGDMADFISPIFKDAPNKNVAGEKRLHDLHHAPFRGPFHSQPRKKNFQAKISGNIGCGNVLMLWLRSGAIPRLMWSVHQLKRLKNEAGLSQKTG